MADLDKEPVQAEPFNFTKYTGIAGAAGTGIVAAVAGLNQLINKDTNPTVALGIWLAVGLVALAIAITAAADVLARAYVTSLTTVDPANKDKLLPASAVLATAMEKRGNEPKLVSMPHIKGIKVRGETATLLALRTTGDKTEFQIIRGSAGTPEWVEPVAVEFP